MRNRHHYPSAIAALALVVTAATSIVNMPRASAAAKSKLKLSGVVGGTADPFWQSIVCGAQSQATKRGVTLKTYTTTGFDTNILANNFQAATLAKPNGIFAFPQNPGQFSTQYKALMAKGVPVVNNGGTSPRVEYQAVFSDADTGRFAAEALAGASAGAGTLVYLGGIPGIPPLEARLNPFLAAVAAARPDLKRVDEYSMFDPNKAATDLAALFLAHPDIKVIVAADGPDAIGAANAVKQANLVGKVTLIAFDAVPPEVDFLKSGVISVLIAQNPAAIGRGVVDSLVDYLKKHPKGGKVPTTAPFVGVPQKLLTAKTVDAAENADYLYKAAC
jgi:ribose transport system substrate-binding protein